jgi:tRNA(Arg) A34 adenosine deaminase TadA
MSDFIACLEAEQGLSAGDGGPFGAIVVKDGRIIGQGHNRVLSSHDSTAHAEITAIRDAERTLGNHDLSGCEIYTTCFPCPMCLGAHGTGLQKYIMVVRPQKQLPLGSMIRLCTMLS